MIGIPQETIERIVLVGLSGTGKSTVARLLADRLGWETADSDEWIVAATGRPIADLFAQEGEAAFRQVEAEAVRALCARPRLVLATGGGVVTVEENWPHLRRHARVVWLQARPETLVARLAAQADAGMTVVRPLLAGATPLERLRAMAAARAPLYARADIALPTDGLTPAAVAEAVLTTLPAGDLAAPVPTGRREGQ